MRMSIKEYNELMKRNKKVNPIETDNNTNNNSQRTTNRITREEYQEMMKKQKLKNNKYNNKKVKVDDHLFDSKKEAYYYLDVKAKKKEGKIKDFELQPKFLLQEGFEKNGKKHRAIHYIADFKIIHNDDSIEIVDVKGFKTNVFRIKEKLFEYKYPNLSLTII